MTDTRKFEELVSWHAKPVAGFGMGWDPGWRPNGGAFTHNISPSDPYWGEVLEKAQAAYGDPGMRFNTSDPTEDRYLMFSDGTRVPTDGSLAYRDNGNTYVLNDDGSVSLLGGGGETGQPFFPEFRRNDAGQYVPVDSQGRQVAPMASSYVDDPATGKRTYYNADGDVVGVEPQPRNGAPAGSAAGVETDEQQSGRTAEAVRKLHEEMKDRYSNLSEAEGRLSEVMLTARTTTAEGQQKLNDIQQKIVEAVNNPAMSLDTPAGEQAFLKFLRSQVAAIGEVLNSGTLTSQDHAKAAGALAELYRLDHGGAPNENGNADPAGEPDGAAPAAPAVSDPGFIDPALAEAALGPMEPMPDPLTDLGMGGPLGPDPLAGLASALPAAMSAFPPGGGLGGGSPLDALTGAAAPLAGLASQLGEQAARQEPDPGVEPDENEDDGLDDEDQSDSVDAEPPPATSPQSDTPPEPVPADTPGDTAPPAAPGPPPPPPPTTIALPDGSTANARTPELAQAVKAHLEGTPLEEAYRAQHLELPPPGTPVTNPVDPSRLSAGMLAVFNDHFAVALSSVKALEDGQVVPASSIASLPGFLGWLDPTAVGAPAPTPAPVPPPTPMQAPAATTMPTEPVPTPTG
ncbi:DUF4226 domain-containing protein [Mycobacterium lehmannii]|uniref:DUF4226 domain-containing protein n=1 Tax=Mycobacterium lehmannii TaxID=2048550 RepID=UPI000B944AE9|nr:DUF4226 domain-containing protein [Mycobacterium lehmannii]